MDSDGSLLFDQEVPPSYFVYPEYNLAIPIRTGLMMSWDTTRIHYTTKQDETESFAVWGSASQVSKRTVNPASELQKTHRSRKVRAEMKKAPKRIKKELEKDDK